jgi:predicted small secreted protein
MAVERIWLVQQWLRQLQSKAILLIFEKFHRGITMRQFLSISLITRLALIGLAGMLISACSSTMEGMGKDLQTMGNAMGGTQSNNPSQTKGKDVVVTPVK